MQQIVVREGELKAGYMTGGIVREKAFEPENGLVSRTRVRSGAVSGWHHHGARDLYGFVVSGQLRLEYGSKGREWVEVKSGDFFHISPGLVHRDLNLGGRRELLVANILVGTGEPVVSVEDTA